MREQLNRIRLSEFMIGLTTGSIVLLVGSAALHGQGGHLPWFSASPLLLLGGSVLYGLLLMAAQLALPALTWAVTTCPR